MNASRMLRVVRNKDVKSAFHDDGVLAHICVSIFECNMKCPPHFPWGPKE